MEADAITLTKDCEHHDDEDLAQVIGYLEDQCNIHN